MRKTKTGTRFLLKDDSVNYAGTPVQQVILDAAGKVYAASSQPLVITSANDGEHMDGSLHYEDKALDLRVWNLDNHERAARQISRLLGEEYDVIAEWRQSEGGRVPSHIHVEYDPPGGDT